MDVITSFSQIYIYIYGSRVEKNIFKIFYHEFQNLGGRLLGHQNQAFSFL